eukprot:TRINITY_DN1080_c0_g5_i1.p1 TRINITY_DN1080_c0_g5~~TRINITY_DN1080_c0_g5_i1.p1  ORF type:complete len:385 (+),score=109.41 TRINITY_DN1080_c0_g5_i1:59-1156(+)
MPLNEYGYEEDVYKKASEELEKRVKDKLPDNEKYDKMFVERFLRARKCDVKKAEEMLLESLKWRKEHDVDTVLDRKPDPRIVRYFPHAFLGQTQHGRQVYFERTGRSCLPGPEMISLDDLFKWKVWQSEYLDDKLRNSPKKTVVCVLDMDGLSMSMLTKHVINFVKMVGEVEEKNYPESLHKVFVINAGWAFSGCYKIVKYFFAEEIREKIRVFTDSGYEKELYESVPPEIIPTFIKGGKNKYEDQEWAGDLTYQRTLPQSSEHEGLHNKETIKAGAIHEHTISVEQDHHIEWAFLTEKHDIEFSLLCPEGKHVHAPKKYTPNSLPEKGAHKAQKKGTYTVVFSNKASWTASKTVRFTVGSVGPE